MNGHGGLSAAPPPEVEIQAAALRQLLAFPEWVRRRVEQVAFVDDGAIRRRVSVDFKLPEWYRRQERLNSWVAPLALLQKRPLVSFDLRDEQGVVLPLLGSDRNQLLVGEALVTTATTILERRSLQLAPELKQDLVAIAQCRASEANEAIANLFEGGRGGRERRCLRRNPLMRNFVEDMARTYPLLVAIKEPAKRRVIKFSYLEELRFPRRSLTRTLGWSSSPFFFPLAGIGMTRSYHCEIDAPEEQEIERAELVSFAGPQREPTSHHDTQSCGERIHLQASEVSPDATGALTLRLRAPLAGMPTSSALLALGVAILLTAGAVFHERIADSAESATAILLTLPAGIAAYLGRPSHQLSRRLLRGIRILNWGVALVVFLAAATMMLGKKSDQDDLIMIAWTSLAAIAWLIALMLGLSAILPNLRRNLRPLDSTDDDWYRS